MILQGYLCPVGICGFALTMGGGSVHHCTRTTHTQTLLKGRVPFCVCVYVPDRTGAVGCSMVLRKAKNHVFRPVKKSDGCGRVFVAIGSAFFCLLPLQGEMVYFVGRCYFYLVPLGKPSSLSVRRGRSKNRATLSGKIKRARYSKVGTVCRE